MQRHASKHGIAGGKSGAVAAVQRYEKHPTNYRFMHPHGLVDH
jgi:hypothetical protein